MEKRLLNSCSTGPPSSQALVNSNVVRITVLLVLFLAGCAAQQVVDCGYFDGEPDWLAAKPDAELEQKLLEAVVGYRSNNMGLTSKPMHEGIYWFKSATDEFLFCAPEKDAFIKRNTLSACFAERLIIRSSESGYLVVEDASIVCT